MDVRHFIWQVWLKADKNLADTVTALEQIAQDQGDVYTRGGRTMISTSVGSESFTYQFSGHLTPDAVNRMCYDAWRLVKRFETVEDFEKYIEADEVDSMRVSFRNMRDL